MGMPTSFATRAAGCIALAAALLGGCGGDDKKKPEGARALSVQQARAVRIGTPKAAILQQFGKPKHLGSPFSPTRGRSCFYYPIALKREAIDPSTTLEWRYCFRRDRVYTTGTAEFQKTGTQQPSANG